MGVLVCPACQRQLDAPQGCAGLPVHCAACQHTFTALEPAAAPAQMGAPPDEAKKAPERFDRPLRQHRGQWLLALGLWALLAVALQHVGIVVAALLVLLWCWRAATHDLRAVESGTMGPPHLVLLRTASRLGLAGALLAALWLLVRLLQATASI